MDDEFTINELLFADGLMVIIITLMLTTKGCIYG